MKDLIKYKKISVIQNFIKDKTGTNSITDSMKVMNTKTKGNTIIFEPNGGVGIDTAVSFVKDNILFPTLFILNDTPYTNCLNTLESLTFRGAYKKLASGDINLNLDTGFTYENMNFNNRVTMVNCKGFVLSDVIFDELILDNCFNFEFTNVTCNKLTLLNSSSVSVSGINMPHNSLVTVTDSSAIVITNINPNSEWKIRLNITRSDVAIASNDKLLPNNIITSSAIEFRVLTVKNSANLFILNSGSSFIAMNIELENVTTLLYADGCKGISIAGKSKGCFSLFKIQNSDSNVIDLKDDGSINIFDMYRTTNNIISIVGTATTDLVFARFEENLDSNIKDSTFKKVFAITFNKNVKLRLNNIAIPDSFIFNFNECIDYTLKNVSIT